MAAISLREYSGTILFRNRFIEITVDLENGTWSGKDRGTDTLAFKDAHRGTIALGEHGGLRPDGFDYPNSPAIVSRLDLAGRTLVQRTSAGTRGVVAAADADRPVAPAVWASRTKPRMVWPEARKSSMMRIFSSEPRNSGETINSTVRPLVWEGVNVRNT